MDIVTYAYLATLLCVFIVEVRPRGRLAHVAALSSIVLVTAGGVAWSYAAYFKRSAWPTFAFERTVREIPAGQRTRMSQSEDGVDAEDADDDAGAGTGGHGARPRTAPAGASGQGRGQKHDPSKPTMIGVASLQNGELADDQPMADCDGCPPLIAVPAGTASIGADETDRDATEAERPTVKIRFWPGFMIGAAPVTAAAFQEFQIATNRGATICGPKTANLSPLTAAPLSPASDTEPAACITAGDAEAYVTWLTARTGKRFRLPTAAEWEYAAKVVAAPGLLTGSVAEIVADCWHTHIPASGFERIAAQTGSIGCDGRMLKGGGRSEAARYHRSSARRRIDARETGAAVGFRVMRSHDGLR
jgi:formylglycine-generating enzyme required for sulfatase activity